MGRTGAGKSSITLALTNIINIEEGNMLIEGKDVRNYNTIKEFRN